jgi:hypothetical protein
MFLVLSEQARMMSLCVCKVIFPNEVTKNESRSWLHEQRLKSCLLAANLLTYNQTVIIRVARQRQQTSHQHSSVSENRIVHPKDYVNIFQCINTDHFYHLQVNIKC